MKVFSVSITIAATLTLVLGYALSSLWSGSLAAMALGLLWLVGQRHRLGWPADLGFFSLVATAAFGVWWGLSAGWMLLGLVTALMAWDLDRFIWRLERAEQIEGKVQIQRHHLQRLLLVAGLGLLSGGIALSIQLELNLGWIIFLGLLVFIGLSRVAGAGSAKRD